MHDWIIVNNNAQKTQRLVCVSTKGMGKEKESQFSELGTETIPIAQTPFA